MTVYLLKDNENESHSHFLPVLWYFMFAHDFDYLQYKESVLNWAVVAFGFDYTFYFVKPKFNCISLFVQFLHEE